MNPLLPTKRLAHRLWIIIFTAGIGVVLLISIALLVWTDTYSVLGERLNRFIDEPNRNFLKVEHILENPNRYNGFIFGSSRVGAILPSHVKGGKFYNMTYSEGIPHEHLLNLQLFLKQGIKIKKVLLGLDEFSYQVSFLQHQHQWLTRAHPLATGSSWSGFYRFYFFRLPTQHDKRQFLKKYSHPDQRITVDITDQDRFYQKYLTKNKNVRSNHPLYLKPTLYHGNTLPETLQDIREIVYLCKQNNIELTVFINPIHHTTYKHTNHNLLKQFKQELNRIIPYYDFSGPNKITQNNANFVDTSHYTVNIGDQMLQCMSTLQTAAPDPAKCSDFLNFKPFKSK